MANHTYYWDFGDGNISYEANPQHVYAAAGTYTVSLTVSDGITTDTLEKVSYVTVNEPANFTFKYNTAEYSMVYYSAYVNAYGEAGTANQISGYMDQTEGADETTYPNLYQCLVDSPFRQTFRGTQRPLDDGYIWCSEIEIGQTPGVGSTFWVGLKEGGTFYANRNFGGYDTDVVFYKSDGEIGGYGSNVFYDTYSAGDIIGVVTYVNGGSSSVMFFKNGVFQGESASFIIPAIACGVLTFS